MKADKEELRESLKDKLRPRLNSSPFFWDLEWRVADQTEDLIGQRGSMHLLERLGCPLDEMKF